MRWQRFSQGQRKLRNLSFARLGFYLFFFLVAFWIACYLGPYQRIRRYTDDAHAKAVLANARAAAQRLKSMSEYKVLRRCFNMLWAGEPSEEAACRSVSDFVDSLRAAGPIMPLRSCGQEYNRTGVCDGGCFFAGNLHNAQPVLPSYIYHMAHIVADLSEHGNPAFISIYESGSTDYTPGWLQVLQDVLSALSIPYDIQVNGSVQREKGEERIHFLARVRSAALTPLFDQCARRGTFCPATAAGNSRSSSTATTITASKATRSGKGSGRPGAGGGRIVFLNDVFFTAPDVLRLLQYPAALVCGLDLGMAALPDLTTEEHQATVAAYLEGRRLVPQRLAHWLVRARPLRKAWLKFHRKYEGALREFAPLFFYDKWVARDISGRMFTNRSPYVVYGPSVARVTDGRPVRVHCCWNGLAVIAAEPLVSGRVAFRQHNEGECSASECSLLCDDLWRSGFTDIVMDPNVRVTYDMPGARRVFREFTTNLPLGAPGLSYTPFRSVDVAEVLALPLHDDLTREAGGGAGPSGPRTRQVDCCGLRPGEDMVEFREPGVCYNTTVPLE